MIGVLVTQHSKWIAGRIRRALFGQTTSSEVASTDYDWQKELAQKAGEERHQLQIQQRG